MCGGGGGCSGFVFFFNDTATTEIYTLSLHDALPIYQESDQIAHRELRHRAPGRDAGDRKSTRLNSSHQKISYAVFCLKKKNKQRNAKSLTLKRNTGFKVEK